MRALIENFTIIRVVTLSSMLLFCVVCVLMVRHNKMKRETFEKLAIIPTSFFVIALVIEFLVHVSAYATIVN